MHTLTPPGRQAYWPSLACAKGALWLATCSPNVGRTGYDCLVTAHDREAPSPGSARTYRINEGLSGHFHLYPQLVPSPAGDVWLAWYAVTPHDYYAVRDRVGNARYTYLQDDVSRARRSVWWNAAVPEVRRLAIEGDRLGVDRPAGAEQDRLLAAFGHGHHPRLVLGKQGAPGLVLRRWEKGTRIFRTCASGLGDDGWLPPAPLHDDRLAPRRNGPIALDMDESRTAMAFENHGRARTAGFHVRETASGIGVVLCNTDDVASEQGCVPLMSDGCREPVPPPDEADSGRAERGMLFGNFHVHTDLSICRRDTQQSPDFNYRWCMDLMRQDFTGLTDHAEGMTACDWKANRLLADFFNFPGAHVALLSYEWVCRRTPEGGRADGHVNVHYRGSDGPLWGHGDAEGETLDALWVHLPRGDALTIAHHTATSPFLRDWRAYDPRFEPVVEIYQDRRGSYEYHGAPAAPGVAVPEQGREHVVDGHYVRDALRLGHKLGFCSGGDHMGISMTAIPARELTRASVFSALAARRCYAVTGARIVARLRLTCGDATAEMGEEASAEGRVEIVVDVEGTAAVSEIALIQDGEARSTQSLHGSRAGSAAFTVAAPPKGATSYAYVRIRQVDGQLAWLSPVWLTGRESSG